MKKGTSPWSVEVTVWLYRCLLRIGPSAFRREYADPAVQDFRQCCRDAYGRRGVLGVLLLWLPTLSETVMGMLAERREALPRPVRLLLPVAFVFLLVLFPFTWLSQVWPTFATIFDRVFATALAHEIGHVVLFCVTGLVTLYALRFLQGRFLLYALLLMAGALGEEVVQALVRSQIPVIDGKDMLLDLSGVVLAYVFISIWQWFTTALARRA